MWMAHPLAVCTADVADPSVMSFFTAQVQAKAGHDACLVQGEPQAALCVFPPHAVALARFERRTHDEQFGRYCRVAVRSWPCVAVQHSIYTPASLHPIVPTRLVHGELSLSRMKRRSCCCGHRLTPSADPPMRRRVHRPCGARLHDSRVAHQACASKSRSRMSQFPNAGG